MTTEGDRGVFQEAASDKHSQTTKIFHIQA